MRPREDDNTGHLSRCVNLINRGDITAIGQGFRFYAILVFLLVLVPFSVHAFKNEPKRFKDVKFGIPLEEMPFELEKISSKRKFTVYRRKNGRETELHGIPLIMVRYYFTDNTLWGVTVGFDGLNDFDRMKEKLTALHGAGLIRKKGFPPPVREDYIWSGQSRPITILLAYNDKLRKGIVSYVWKSRSASVDEPRIAALSRKYRGLKAQGRHQEAVKALKELIELTEKLYSNNHAKVILLHNDLARLYMTLGNYAEAEAIQQKMLATVEATQGKDHPSVATCLNNLSVIYFSRGHFMKAAPLLERTLHIREKTLGANHPDTANSLNNLAMVYKHLGDNSRTEPLYHKALSINEKRFGPEHPAVARNLNNLASLYSSAGDYPRAEPLFKRSLAIREKTLGPEHPDVAHGLNNLAELYRLAGDFSKAEPLYHRALAIKKKAYGPEHPEVATILNNLAGLYRSVGDFARAEFFQKKALAMAAKILGPEHIEVARFQNNLALLYESYGDYSKAEALYQGSLKTWEAALGPEHPDVATNLNNLAGIYIFLGDYNKAKALYKRSLKIWETAFGPEHPHVATNLNNLAELYSSTGNFIAAESLFKRALTIMEKTLGAAHPAIATSLNNMANLYLLADDYPKAEAFCKRALQIQEKAYGPAHPDTTISLNILAELYRTTGDFDRAETLFKKALTIIEKSFGPEHIQVATILNNMAVLHAGEGHFEKSHKLLMRAQKIDDKLIDQVMTFTSEDQKIKFLSEKKWELNGFLSLINDYIDQNPGAARDALDVWLKRKGIALEAQRRFQEALVYSDDPQTLKTFRELSGVRARLSKLAFAGPGKEGRNAHEKRCIDLEAEKDRLEARLSKLSRAFTLKKKIERADCAKVARSLPDNTVLIEFAMVMMFDFKAKGTEKRWKPAHYIAFVLHAGAGDTVEMIDLGNANDIDAAVARLKRDICGTKDINTRSSREVHDLVFAPIRKALGYVREIFVSPDGNLNLIPFEVLQTPEGRFLIEEYTFNYLAAGRDILGFGQVRERGKKALIMGDPDFDMGTKEKNSTMKKLALAATDDGDTARRAADMMGFHFERLPGTREEVEKIGALLGKGKADIYTGQEALEEVLGQKGTPTILHLATHGFFLCDLEINAPAGARGLQVVSTGTASVGRRIKIENPLLRSGIALAGANRALKTGAAENSDGIVTAEKILGLRLRGTDMVVLSACETGLGEARAGEGVYGLRRAFIQAGARSMVMSMWSVPDRETRELMVAFYKNVCAGRMNRCIALRRAALKQMQLVKKRYGYPHPFYWGAFLFLGEP